MNATPRILLQVGASLGLGLAGYALGSSAIDKVRQHDLNADPIRVLSDDGTTIEEVPNTPHTGLATFGATAVGVALAAGGALLALGHNPAVAEAGLLRALAGIGLLGAGAGIIGGALATASSTADMTSRPNRSPSTTGISITPPVVTRPAATTTH
ncbi:MAG: hypothetical protein H7287_00030 [Thermoleophilia bacterium]|nr:hypothetical protein [Thermoleophilia bacterium]